MKVEFKKLVAKGEGWCWFLENVTLFKPYVVTSRLHVFCCNIKKHCV